MLPALSLTDALAVSARALAGDRAVRRARAVDARERRRRTVHLIATSSLYQPAAFGSVVGAPLSVGSVLSMLMPDDRRRRGVAGVVGRGALTDWFGAFGRHRRRPGTGLDARTAGVVAA